MKLPLLKYYLPSPLSLKLRLYFTLSAFGDFGLEKLTLERCERDCVECLVYAQTDACDPTLLSSVQGALLWIKNYLAGISSTPLPLMHWPSSAFALLTLKHLAEVPFGTTLTYQELAMRMGHPKAARAVGTALHNNPFPLILPCHRVVSKKDGIGGFAYAITLKKALLDFEASQPSSVLSS